jgi:glycosyltransferase involved in cell wall biosynthesis
MPFDSSVTGASLRASELHRRLPADHGITVFTTSAFPDSARRSMPGLGFRDLAGSRRGMTRFLEFSGSWWKRRLRGTGCRLWVTDTLPVVRMDGIRTCLTVHDLRHRESPGYVKPGRFLLLRLFMSSSLRRADSVIAVSRWGAGELRRLYGVDPGKITVIPNGVDPGLAESVRGTGRPADDPFILSVGHLEPRKNQQLLLRAFATMKDRWQGRLVLAGRDLGSGPELHALASSLGIGDRVDFTGAMDRQSLLSLYGSCRLLVCPSAYEGFGITLLEGMVLGIPVVASGIPPHREVGGDAVMWVDDHLGGVQEMADSILSVLDDADLARSLTGMGRSRAELFSWDESAARLDRLYRDLTG